MTIELQGVFDDLIELTGVFDNFTAPETEPSLDFSDIDNSQYLWILWEETILWG